MKSTVNKNKRGEKKVESAPTETVNVVVPIIKKGLVMISRVIGDILYHTIMITMHLQL